MPHTSSTSSIIDDAFLFTFWTLQSLLVLGVLAFTTFIVLLLAAKSDPSFAFISWILFLILTIITLSLTCVEIHRYFSARGLSPKTYLLYQQVKTTLSLVIWTVLVICALIEPGSHSLGTENIVKAGVVCQIPFMIPLIYAARRVTSAGHTSEEDWSGQNDRAPLLRS
ncbi:uncharacterized protein BP5553_05980 [Venustampulla echinocandica]|uniref:Uncharacterized protein n=1 Tax=Venustampulla echinocandica TaxID=2656787 RepID=A0A370TM85_9HELO|nr:uncharacterized protein BP5553_05980 [Venustampulla echinocandica]RDL36628.1 hypothetical protein BP5553_05980 [Venustampulla echinocandica]